MVYENKDLSCIKDVQSRSDWLIERQSIYDWSLTKLKSISHSKQYNKIRVINYRTCWISNDLGKYIFRVFFVSWK